MLLWLVPLASSDPLAETEAPIPAEVLDRMEATRAEPPGIRMAAVSEPLLGADYRVDPAGEGVAPDPDPIARYDAFDCVTFVEEVLALALAPDPSSVDLVRAAYRWRAEPSYLSRRHFWESEWIPENVAAGRLRDITAEVGPATVLHKEVSLDTWQAWGRRSKFPHLPDERLPVGSYDLAILPLAAARAHAEEIPVGTIVVTVREARPWIPIVVTHVGFVVPPGPDGKLRVRHATKMGGGVVRDHGLAWYLEHLESYDAWPPVGVTLLAPVEWGPRDVRAP